MAKQDYEAALSEEAVGVVLHDHNFASNPKIFVEWLEFLRQKDPKGARHTTASRYIDDYLALLSKGKAFVEK